jgi:hypothetical protein
VPRKAVYNQSYHDQWAWSLAIRGCDDKEIAAAFSVSRKTISAWKNSHPSFKAALSEGKEIADSRVEKSLYQSAIGYDCEESENIIEFDANGNQKPLKVKKSKKHIAANTTAQIFWLKNRQKDRWNDVNRTEITGADGNAVEFQQVQVYLPEKEELG